MAQEFYGYFGSVSGDIRRYNAAGLSRGFRIMCDSGVKTLENDSLRVNPADSGLRTRIGYGGAMVQGYPYELYDDGGSPMLLEHTLVTAYPRIDRVVLRLDLDSRARYIKLAIVEGVEAVSPAPPELTRSGTIYEISLAQCRVNPGATLFTEADITDERGDPELCGNIREDDTYAAYVSQVELPATGWVENAADGQYYATVSAPGVLLGDYVYTVSPTPETSRTSENAGGVLMQEPTVAGRGTFAVPAKPEGAVVMVIKREVVKEG